MVCQADLPLKRQTWGLNPGPYLQDVLSVGSAAHTLKADPLDLKSGWSTQPSDLGGFTSPLSASGYSVVG